MIFRPGSRGQHMFPPRLPQVPVVFVSQGNTTARYVCTLLLSYNIIMCEMNTV